MKKYLLILAFCISCGSNEEIPKEVISQRKMSGILYDMTIIYQIKNYNSSVIFNSGLKPKKYLFEKYDIDSLKFVKSVKYYSRKPRVMAEIYKEVLRKLNKKGEELKEIEDDKKQETN